MQTFGQKILKESIKLGAFIRHKVLSYVGVILGPDIQYDSKRDCLICLHSLNKERNLTNIRGELLIRNIYRVLLTRGRKGC